MLFLCLDFIAVVEICFFS